jgi:hypothetical protein
MRLSPAEDAWRSLFNGFVEPTATRGPTLTAAGPAPQRPFRFFSTEDQDAASVLAAEFDALAGRKADNNHPRQPTRKQLAAVMARFHEAAADNVGLAQAALRIFVARWPNADVLPMPTLRQQLATLQNEQPQQLAMLSRAAERLTASPSPEDVMAYYRHDLDLSDHHLHWHTLYRWSEPVEDMQGRLFVYMHQQMLARYDTERFAAGLTPVVALLQWDAPQSWKAAFADKTLPKDALAPWITAFWIKDQDVPAAAYVAFDEKGTSPGQNVPAKELKLVLDGLRRVHDGIAARSYDSYNAVGADLEASNRPADRATPARTTWATASCPLSRTTTTTCS